VGKMAVRRRLELTVRRARIGAIGRRRRASTLTGTLTGTLARDAMCAVRRVVRHSHVSIKATEAAVKLVDSGRAPDLMIPRACVTDMDTGQITQVIYT
jgi:hypothetical protein